MLKLVFKYLMVVITGGLIGAFIGVFVTGIVWYGLWHFVIVEDIKPLLAYNITKIIFAASIFLGVCWSVYYTARN